MAYYNFDDNVGGPDPIYIKCQYCHGEGPTRVESKTATWRQRLNASMAGTIMALTCCCPCSLMCCCLPPLWCCMMPLCGFKINKHYCQSCGTRVYKVCCPYYWCSHLKLSVKLQRVVFLILKLYLHLSINLSNVRTSPDFRSPLHKRNWCCIINEWHFKHPKHIYFNWET